MGKVKRLDENLVNLIAAGEVVERPASLVKELVENALDAGARHIRVAYEAGGLKSVAVSDDGEGMSPDDALLSLERHATSKISLQDDLDRIRTLGFRGEALPSIAQVSRLEILTRRREEEMGTRILVEGGRILLREVAGSSPGTTMTVRDIFYNTPARKEYMKAPETESAKILEGLGRLAFSSPGVQFDVSSEGHPVLGTEGNGDLRGVAASLWGLDVADRLLTIFAEQPGITVEGLISRPDASRSNRQGQVLLVNGRPVQNLRIRYAAEEAYRSLLMKGRFPYLVLVVTVSPEAIDPNVHPTKWEVRLAQEAEITRAAYEACRSTLLPKVPGTPDARSHAGSAFGESLAVGSYGFQAAAQEMLFASESAAQAQGVPPLPQARSQVAGLFIVAEGQDALYLVDQHAAHERVGYDRLVGRPDERASQPLLTPMVLTLGPEDREHLSAWAPALEEEGFVVEPFGRAGETVLRAIPSFLGKLATPRLLTDLLAELAPAPKEAMDRRRHLWMAMAACRAAVKKRDILSLPEQEALLAALWATEEPRHCPHGRPTWLRVPYAQLEHRFGRT